MKLAKARIWNYRTIRDIEVQINPDITLIVGKNNIGKSNVLKAMDLFFKNLAQKDVIFEEEDFRFNTSSIKIRLTFDMIDEHIQSIERQLIKMSSKRRPNQKNIKDLEVIFHQTMLYKNRYNELKVEMEIDRSTRVKQVLILDGNETRQKLYKEKILKRIILERYSKGDGIVSHIQENAQSWFSYSNLRLEEVGNNIYRLFDANNKLIAEETILSDKIKELNSEQVQRDFVSYISRTQKFLYVQAFRGGKREREEAIEKLFEIVIDQILGQGATSEYDVVNSAIWNTGRQKTGLFLNKVVESKIEELINNLKDDSISSIQSISFKSLSQIEIRRSILRTLLGTNNILLDDGVPTSFESKGTGIQSAFMITLMKALSKLEFIDSLNIILVIEEPEAFTHPQLTREIIDRMTSNTSDSNFQFIVTTHSPVIVNFIDCRKIQRLYEKTGSKLKETKNAMSINEGPLNEEDWGLLNRLSDINMSEIVFADFVLFVEGEGDKAVLSLLLKEAIPAFYHRISIISISGYNQIFRLNKLLKKFGINWLMLVDKDAFVLKEYKTEKLTHSNIDDFFEIFHMNPELKPVWERFLNHPGIDVVKFKSNLDSATLKHGELFKKVGEISIEEASIDKINLFKTITDKMEDEFLTDQEQWIAIDRINKELYKSSLPLFLLSSDLESFVINHSTCDIVSEYYKANYPNAFADFDKQYSTVDQEIKTDLLRKRFGSKGFKIERISESAQKLKKPHVPIEIISTYLNFIKERKTGNILDVILNDFPSLDLLLKIIEANVFPDSFSTAIESLKLLRPLMVMPLAKSKESEDDSLTSESLIGS